MASPHICKGLTFSMIDVEEPLTPGAKRSNSQRRKQMRRRSKSRGAGGGTDAADMNEEASAAAGAGLMCVVCLDAENTHALVPCGHKCVCNECADLLLEQ